MTGRRTLDAVVNCPQCDAWCYSLSADGVVLLLDPTDHPDGVWLPQPDGRTVEKVASGGHREHDCRCDQLGLFGEPA